MRLAFVHGINNEKNTAASIEAAWWDALSAGWQDLGLRPKPKPVIDTAYYADILAGAAKGTDSDAIAMGARGPSTQLAIELLNEYAAAADITEPELNAAAEAQGIPREAVAQGIPHEGWIIRFADLVEGILPDKGLFVARLFLRQAATYIGNRALAARIDATVNAQVFDGRPDPTVVVAHSLGTVVAYRLLAGKALARRDTPLFVTLGSPLSVAVFKEILPPRGSMPKPPIAKWLNGRSREDFVTLGRPITKATIGFDGIVDEVDIVNADSDQHAVVRYLASPTICRPIYDAIQ